MSILFCSPTLAGVDISWQECLKRALQKMDKNYLTQLMHTHDWLPGKDKIFNAFSLPLDKVNYVLFGESPYPRRESANGYAFWDASVKEIWSETGLSKKVNRATSLRHIIKMLLVAEGLLKKQHTNQEAISRINKENLVETNEELFQNLIDHGFLLLNATLVLQSGPPHKDAKAWAPFIKELLDCLLEKRPSVKLILLGRIANTIDNLISKPHVKKIYTQHPYNVSFITEDKVIHFFKPMHLLRKSI